MEENTLGLEVLKELASKVKMQWKVIKLLTIALIITNAVCILAVVAMYMSTLNFMSQYEYSTEVDIKADGDSSAIYQNGKGNVVNGSESESNKENDNEKEIKTAN